MKLKVILNTRKSKEGKYKNSREVLHAYAYITTFSLLSVDKDMSRSVQAAIFPGSGLTQHKLQESVRSFRGGK